MSDVWAPDEAFEGPGEQDKGRSWAARGYDPFAGVSEPNYNTQWATLVHCPECDGWYADTKVSCEGGFFSCWARGRSEPNKPVHRDYHCRTCGHVWTSVAEGKR